jgi:hypothetical protein
MTADIMARVISVSARDGHGLGKAVCDTITLIAGEGVAGDAHCGVKVKHRSRVAQNPDQPNLRQVHLIGAELLDELAGQGFEVQPGALGENILTRGIDLLALATGARLHIGDGVVIAITGLRNPCHQLNGHSAGLMNALLDKTGDGSLIRKGGVMGIIICGGTLRAGDGIRLEAPTGRYTALQPV